MTEINGVALERQFSSLMTGRDLMAQLEPLLAKKDVHEFVEWAEQTLDTEGNKVDGPNALFYGILSALRDYDSPSFDWIMYCLSVSRNDDLVCEYWQIVYEAKHNLLKDG